MRRGRLSGDWNGRRRFAMRSRGVAIPVGILGQADFAGSAASMAGARRALPPNGRRGRCRPSLHWGYEFVAGADEVCGRLAIVLHLSVGSRV
jgi:hypothetical protein